MSFVNTLLRDLRYAARVLFKTPATTAIAVLALALGIGVNASSFISINSLVLHPLPYPRLGRIVGLWETLPELRTEPEPLAPANFFDLKQQSSSFEKIAAYRQWEVTLTGIDVPERVQAFTVAPDFFAILGMNASLGRTLSSNDDEPARSSVVVVSQGFWKSHLAASPDVIGKPISLNGRRYTIAGVMPDDFDYPLGTQIWSPLSLEPNEQHRRANHNLMALGLLKPNVSAARASAEAATIASRLALQYPGTNAGRSIVALPFRIEREVMDRFVETVVGAAAFVLLLACANIGNLQLARAANRQKEIAVRAALGASRFAIARQLITESVLISCVAGFVGLLLASWNNAYVKSTFPAFALRVVPGLRTMRVDSMVVVLTFAVSILAGIVCSLPAIAQLVHRRMRADLTEVLRDRGSNAAFSPRNHLRTVLVVCELAFALVLLVGAGLMVQTFERLLNRNQGFDPKKLLTFQISLPATEYKDPARITALYNRLLSSFERLHDVKAAGFYSPLGTAEHFYLEGLPEPRAGEPRPQLASINNRYLEALRIPILQGRSVSDRDRPESPRVVVISETIARHYWPKSSPIGRRIKLDANSDWLTIVGVSGDVIEDWFSGQPSPAAYIPYTQFPSESASFALRTAGDPLQAALAVRARIRSVDKNLAMYEVETKEQAIADERSGVGAAARAMSTFALIALLLAATGIYAVVSYFVAARTHDIGVHMALGASRADVLKMAMRQSLRLTVLGLAFGIPLAILLAHVMSSALYDVVNLDPATFAIFAGVLALSALLASYLPSRRATRIDPMSALREE